MTDMPNEREQEIAAAVAEAIGQGRSTADGLVLTGAQERAEGGYGGSSFVQVLDPRAGATGRHAGLLRAAQVAGLLAEDFRPTVVRDFATGNAIEVLTPGQVKVLRCAAQGLSYTETAEALRIGVSTVKGHVGAYYKRLGVRSVPEAVVAAIRCGVLPLSFLTGQEAPEAEAPEAARPAQVRCSAEGCRKRTTHASGTCRDHRA